MALLLTLDASVFVAACRRGEPDHADSRSLMDALRQAEIPLIEPSILPVEVAAALRRTGSPASLAAEFSESILSLPGLTLVTLDERSARRAVAAAVQHHLRGADALYVAAALPYGAYLVTLDDEQRRRAPSAVHACRPEKAMEWF